MIMYGMVFHTLHAPLNALGFITIGFIRVSLERGDYSWFVMISLEHSVVRVVQANIEFTAYELSLVRYNTKET